MKILILLLFCLNITYVNANEIYNLLKIPNLEIFKLKNNNGIRYLKTNKNFQIGVDDNIKCKKTKKTNLDKKFPIIENNLSLYSSTFLRKIQLKYIVLCEDLFISEINTGGIPDIKKRTLILDINFNQKYFERMIHHEIFHMIQNSHAEYFDENEFSSFNHASFEYAKCSTCSNRLNLDLYENTNGFLTEYSKSIPSEDMAEIFSFLMTDINIINEKIKNDKILSNKVNFIKFSLAKIDKNIL